MNGFRRYALMVVLLIVLMLVGTAVGSDISSKVDAVITTNRTVYNSGETAIVTVDYKFEQGSASPGDYIIISLPADIVSKASFSASPQHFSSVEDLGNGQYKLTLGENAVSSLSGSMSIYVTTNTTTEQTGTISLDDATATFTVVPTGGGASGGVVGYEDEAIMKDGYENDGVSYGGYDYSEGYGNLGAQIGIIDSSKELKLKYRLFVNRKNCELKNVIVTDTLPEGMSFDGGTEMVTCWKIDPSTMRRTETPVTPVSVSIEGQQLTVNLGDIDYPVEIDYNVIVPAQDGAKLRNHSEVFYMQDEKNYLEHRDYILQSSNYSAVNGLKSVDKTVISDDPADQYVTYTVTFWDDAAFEAGKIYLYDHLDENITFLYADENEYFTVTQDGSDPQLLHITNAKTVPARTKVQVRFVCDFSKVPVGYTVTNTTGGNTTKTTKVGALVQLTAVKTVDGATPDQTFTFELKDADGTILQAVSSDVDGKVTFDEIVFSKYEYGKTVIYTISEKIPDGDNSFIYDDSVYKVQVTVGSAGDADENGVIPVRYTIEKSGESASSAAFDNKEPTPTPTEEAPTATTETPTATEETPTPTEETPTVTEETPTATEETSFPTESTTPVKDETQTVTPETTPGVTVTPSVPVLPETGISALRPQTLQSRPRDLRYEKSGLTLEIPGLSLIADIVTVPEVDGRAAVAWMGDAVGILEGSSLAADGRIVLTGHNHLNTTEAGPFAMLLELQIGDRIFLLDENGKIHSYSVYANRKIAEADFIAFESIASAVDGSLTLMTCEDERVEGGYANRRIIAAAPLWADEP